MDEKKDPSQPKSSSAVKWLVFLNSNFGLWLAGVLALTVAPNLYQYYGSVIEQKKQEEILRRKKIEEIELIKNKNSEEFSALSTEISYRLSTVLMRLKAADKRFGVSSSQEAREAIENSFYALSRNPDNTYSSLIPQLNNMNGIAILIEMARLAERDGQKKVIKDVAYEISVLTEISTVRSNDGRSAKQLAQNLLDKIFEMNEVFTRFPYLDSQKGSGGFPFDE
jgi:hypothetical protein